MHTENRLEAEKNTGANTGLFFCPAPGNSLYFPVRKSPFMTRFGTGRRFYIGERGNITRLAHDLGIIPPVYL